MSHTDPVAAWHALLDGPVGLESAEWINARQLSRGLAFGDRALSIVTRPRFLSTTGYDILRVASRALLGAFGTAGAAAAADPVFRAQFRLADWEETLLDGSPALHVGSPFSRLDAFIDPDDGIARITEYNAETPAGAGYTDALSEIFLDAPVMRRFIEDWTVRPLPTLHIVLGVLLESWHRFRGVRSLPNIAIVDWDDVPTLSEFALCRDYFLAAGVPCVITTPGALSYEGGVLRDVDGGRIDVIYKRVLIHELIAEGGLDHPMVRAVRDGAVCMVNPFHCKPLHKKASLAVLSDERNADLFSADETRAIATHVPWTRVIEERTTTAGGHSVDLVPHILASRERLVLKPNDDYGGAGIVLGWEVDDATWERSVLNALDAPSIVQERIALPTELFPAIQDGRMVFDDRIVDTAPFCWQGSFMDGLLTRISTSTLVNVTAGGGSTIPSFIVEPR
ncbi:MAG: hypothetical protein H0W15_12120 [Gemmatimonadales bacterium]|nr:hypothetical protein [Gemmatimonadales bacterium]